MMMMMMIAIEPIPPVCTKKTTNKLRVFGGVAAESVELFYILKSSQSYAKHFLQLIGMFCNAIPGIDHL